MFGEKRFGKERFGKERGGFARGFKPRGQRQPEIGRLQREAGKGGEHVSMHDAHVVVPGELLSESPRPMPFAFIDKGKTYSSVMGLYDKTSGKLVPLEGCYLPNLDDIVIGIVTEVKFSGYTLNIKSPYEGFLSAKDTREEFKLGDVVVARVKDVDEVKNVDLTDASRLEGGEIVEINSVKVPRVIGKNSSMINTIQNATKSEIIVGKNGRIWIRGGDSALAIEAILKIEREAHTRGLTDRISMLLKSGSAGSAKGSGI